MLCYLSVYYIVGRNEILTTYKFKCRLDKLDFEGHNISLLSRSPLFPVQSRQVQVSITRLT